MGICHNFFQAAVVSIQLHGCTTWTMTKRMEKKVWRELHKIALSYIEQILEATSHKAAMYGHLPPISKTIQRRRKHAGNNWRRKGNLISYVLLWTFSHGRASVEWPTRIYVQQFYTDTGCSLEDLPEAMDYRDEWKERVREIPAWHDDDGIIRRRISFLFLYTLYWEIGWVQNKVYHE